MPELVRLYIRQVITGFGLSALFVAALLWLDVARLGTLVAGSDLGVLAVAMLWLFNGIVFSGVQFGIAIMRMAEDDTSAGGRRDHRRLSHPVPAVVRAKDARQPGTSD